MWIFPTVSLVFGAVMAWTLYSETNTTPQPWPWRDYFVTVGIGCGSVATMVTAVKALVF